MLSEMLDLERFRVRPGKDLDLSKLSPHADDWIDRDHEEAKEVAQAANLGISAELASLQERLYATKSAKVLIVLQGMDTSGKDSTTKRVFGDGSPLGISVAAFRRPSEEEQEHDYLWRVHAHTPADGEITIFNRSHYEDVLVVRVDGLVPEHRWKKRYDHIVDFEQMLVDEGTVIRKFFLHISRDEQRERLQERVDNPEKHWKFRKGDLDVRAKWGDYMKAYQEALSRTSTKDAPWYVVPANSKWFRDLVVGSVVADALDELHMPWPEPEDDIEGLVIE